MPERKRDHRGRFQADRDPEQAKRESFLNLAHERFKLCEVAEAQWRREALEDFLFYTGEQWAQDIKSQRNLQKRPALTINRVRTAKKIITNEQRQQRPAIQVNPVGDGATVETAQWIQGVVRHVEVRNEAETAYDMGFDHMVIGGLGYLELGTEYLNDSFDQEITINAVRNPFMVYIDPGYQKPDASDAKFGFKIADMTIEEFKNQYPNAQAASLEDFQSVGDNAKDWITKDNVRVADYYYRDDIEVAMHLMEGGEIIDDDELRSRGESVKPVRSRKFSKPAIKYAKITAIDILEEREVVFPSVPLVPVIGEDLDINGKRYLAGMVRDAKDPQRQVNVWESAATEMVMLGPKAPWLIAEGQIEGHEEEWKTSNTVNHAALTYKHIPDVPPPERNQVEPPIQAMAAMRHAAIENLEAVTAVNDASLGRKRPDESGRAVLARQKQGDISNLDYADNLSRTLRRVGRMILAALPKVYDVPRIMRIVKPDQTHSQIITYKGEDQRQAAEQLKQQYPAITQMMDVGVGTYDVTVSVGPSYQTKRQEAVESIMALIQAAPEVLPLVGDLLVGNMDWNNAPEIAKRLKLLALQQFPALAELEGDSPEVREQKLQAQVAAMQQQLQVATQALGEAQQVIQTKQIEHQSKADIAKFAESVKLEIVKLQETTKLSVAQLNASKDANEAYADAEAKKYDLIHTAAHERGLQAADHAHEKEVADQAHEHAMEQGRQQGAIASLQSQQDSEQDQAAAAAAAAQGDNE